MNTWRSSLIAAVLAAAPALGQTTPFPFQMPQLPQLPQMPDLSALQDLSFFFQGNGKTGRPDADYDRGTRALDDRKYDDAARYFDAVIDRKGSRAEGALYWKAYALNRLGRRDDALATIAVLRRDFPRSAWLNEAQALEAEVKQSSGPAASPAQESNDDLKLMAINSLMNADPDRAVPLLEGILRGNSSPQMKDRALFVLTMNRSPQAQQVLAGIAKGGADPDLQLRAIRYIGMTGSNESQQLLLDIYTSSTDKEIKKQVIRSLLTSKLADALLNIMRNEKDQQLRAAAINQLGILHGVDKLVQLYAAESSTEGKTEIINALFITGAGKEMVDLARRETDPALKRQIVQKLSLMHSKEVTDYMMELLK